MKKYVKLILSFLMLVLSSSCKEMSQTQSSSRIIDSQISDLSSKVSLENEKWAYYLNHKPDSIANSYHEHAVKIQSNGEIIAGKEQITSHYANLGLQVDSMYRTWSILANKERQIEYEIGGYKADNGKDYVHLIIWRGDEEENRRDFEFIDEQENSASVDLAILMQRRELWMRLCNKHDVDNLVKELYSEIPLYYNHKPVVKGGDALIKEYQYMTAESYELSLEPIHIEVVNSNLVYEVGRCAGSYGGRYILIWQKDSKGVWKILLDSNI